MDFEDIKTKKKEELINILAEKRASLYDLRLKTSVNQLKDVKSISKVKKQIAQILTVINQLDKAASTKKEV